MSADAGARGSWSWTMNRWLARHYGYFWPATGRSPGCERRRTGQDALDIVRRERPDVLFLDVQMPHMGGFEIVRELAETERPEIVFVTAHDAHAIEAFEVAAVDYLLKPFDDRPVQPSRSSVPRNGSARRGWKPRRRSSTRSSVVMLARVRGAIADAPLDRLVAKSVGRAVFIDVRDIEYLEAEDYYVPVHARGESHLVRESMRDLEQRLPRGFVRIHRLDAGERGVRDGAW